VHVTRNRRTSHPLAGAFSFPLLVRSPASIFDWDATGIRRLPLKELGGELTDMSAPARRQRIEISIIDDGISAVGRHEAADGAIPSRIFPLVSLSLLLLLISSFHEARFAF
jgi:hypothetical protein